MLIIFLAFLDALGALIEAFIGLLEAVGWLIDMVCAVGDIYSWFKGRPNRVERREARAAGEAPPPRDKWNRRVIVLSVLVLVVTVTMLVLRK